MITIISGGQTGVDRGALDGALAKGVSCGGYCPESRQAEDGTIDERYPLIPLMGAGYRKRTRHNVIESDGTVIIYHTQIHPKSGTELTLKTCISKNKPYLLIDMNQVDKDTHINSLIEFVKQHDIKRLNFGGPRESICPNIHAFTKNLVMAMIDKLAAFENL